MSFLRTIYYWVKDVSLFDHIQQKITNLKNVEIGKHVYSFDRKGIQDTNNKKNIYTKLMKT